MTIPLSSIDLGDRGRKTYNRVDELAESIEHVGLVQPIVLEETQDSEVQNDMLNGKRYSVVAGGRRFHALKLLDVQFLHHGVSSVPGTYGYILRGESTTKSVLQEIAENLDREALDWREEVALIVRAWRSAKLDADANSQSILMRDYGSILGVGYADLQAAEYIHDDVVSNPDRYKEVTSIRAAQGVLLKVNANAVAKLAHEKGLTEVPLLVSEPGKLMPVPAQSEPKLPEAGGESTQISATVSPDIEHPVIPLSQSFANTDGLTFMETCAPDSFDHIVTDPDYALEVSRLCAGVGTNASTMSSGVAHDSVAESLADLNRFLQLAFKVVKPFGFCVFFYDIEHHEKLQSMATAAGWSVQRWPLTWRKLDYRSNAAPMHNTCKNEEWAMICRKPDAVLAKAQMTSVYDCMTGKITKVLGHPFAKPLELWKWIFSMISIKGQVIFDPFSGSGSCPIAALEYGLRPVGCEVNPDHYHNMMLNLQVHYKKTLGDGIRFS